jgi:hypothetical protein
MTSFEKFLEKVCFTINPSILDDDMSDFFDTWIARLDCEDLIRYGQLYGENTFIEGRNIQKDIEEIPIFEGTLKALNKLTLKN